MTILPPPNSLGAPQRYDTWRQGQGEAFLRAVDSDKRFVALTLSTGSGKSLIYMVAALATGRRVAVLTATKALENQLLHDFEEVGLRDIRGQTNYPCAILTGGNGVSPPRFSEASPLRSSSPGEVPATYPSAWDGPCHHGYECRYKGQGCEYFDAVRHANRSRLVVTNYAYWIASHRADADALGKFDLLVCDEASLVPDELSGALEISLDQYELRFLGLRFPNTDDLKEWKTWAARGSVAAAQAYKGLRGEAGSVGSSGSTRRRARELKQLIGKLEELNRAKGEWVIDRRGKGVTLTPLWPAPYAEGSLFLGIPRVMLTSATVRPKTLSLLGIQSEEVEIEDCPSTFPVQNRLVTHIPTVRLNHRSSETDVLLWVMRMDQIIGRRLDRKGIIHTVSYDRARLILERSQYKDLMLTHRAGGVAYAVSQFKRAKAPSVLVSPSVTTGVDFPDDECRYQIIAKVPFPDGRDPLVRARTEADPEYGLYLAMQSVVQAAGRGVRSQTDWCETYIVDDMWTWFYGRNQGMAPRWFREAVRRSVVIPLPAPPSGPLVA